MTLSKTIALIISWACLVFFSTACETLMTRSEVENKRQMQDSVSNLQKNSAETNNRFAEIESDLRSLNGKIEVVENKLNISQQDKDKARSISDQNDMEQNKKIQILQEEVTRLSEAVAALSAEVTAIKSVTSENTASSSTKKDMFEQAEDIFDKKDWKKAILTYQKYRDSNPKGKKFADATYKIGVCFQELGMKEDAKTFYDEVVTKFPQSPEAKKAKSRLKSMKK